MTISNTGAVREAALAAFHTAHAKAEEHGKQELEARLEAAEQLWAYHETFDHGEWEAAADKLDMGRSTVFRYLAVGEYLKAHGGQKSEKYQSETFGDFVHDAMVWRDEQDAQAAREEREDAERKAEEARREAEEAERKRDRERAEKRIRKADKRAAKAAKREKEAELSAKQRETGKQMMENPPKPKDTSGRTEDARPDRGRYNRDPGSAGNEFYTPVEVVEMARKVMGGIELDPASCKKANKKVKADRWYGESDDGLAQEWVAKTIWLNPPYSNRDLFEWVDRLYKAVHSGKADSGVILLNNGTETQWGTRALATADAVCFPEGRLHFWGPGLDGESGTRVGQMILYYGGKPDKFVKVFGRIGPVFARAEAKPSDRGWDE